MRKILLFVLIFNLLSYNFLANEIDSLMNLIKLEKNDSIKASLYLEAYVYTKYNNFDSSLKYIKEAEKIAKAHKMQVLLAMCYNDFGNYYEKCSEYDKSLEYYNKSLEIYSKHQHKKGIADAYVNMGIVQEKTGNYEKSLQLYLKGLEIDEQRGDSASIAGSYNNIGLVFRRIGDYNKSREYLLKSVEIKKKLPDKNSLAITLNNLGVAEIMMEDIPAGLKYFKDALKIYEELNNIRGIADASGNIGNVYRKNKDYENAHKYLLFALEKRQEMKEYFGQAKNLIMIADNLRESGKTKEAMVYANKGLELAQKIKTPEIEMESYRSISNIYSEKGDYKNALSFYIKMSEFKDSLYKAGISSTIQELEAKYEFSKKQEEIATLEKEKLADKLKIAEEKEANRQQKLTNEKQKIALFAALIGLLIISIFSIVVFRLFRQKRQANILLNQQKEEILSQRDEIEAQRDLAAQQRDLISEQKQDITDSIQYAYKIQSAIFPNPEEIKLVLNDFFIFYKPRDIVSGDFYWVSKQGKKVIIIAADCTGHGVPGAFMSMLGVAFLNEIVNKENISSPDTILNRLRENIILALKQTNQSGEQKDGMDVAAITIDTENNTVSFSGANNPLYLIKNNKLLEIKGDKMPVSIHTQMKPFTLHKFNVEKNDNVYIFSDGFPDQFGGPKGKKFKYQQFKLLLESISEKPMVEQEKILNETFNNWINYSNNYEVRYEQIDDVLVMGIKL
ncbi:MAG: tetratricopeptide repeat protein [Bacteroidales bacterium]|nr:tetratricopeptide repeat protein [Bacteroidales bacterium]